jgi:polyferredoxin
MLDQEKYERDGNSDEFSKKFHDRAWEIANDLNKQLLNLSTGIIAAIFFLAFNKENGFNTFENFLILLTIVLYGISILFIILGKQWDASKNYFLGNINDSTKQTGGKRGKNENKKREFDKKQRKAKKFARYFFLLGIFSSIVLITHILF